MCGAASPWCWACLRPSTGICHYPIHRVQAIWEILLYLISSFFNSLRCLKVPTAYLRKKSCNSSGEVNVRIYASIPGRIHTRRIVEESAKCAARVLKDSQMSRARPSTYDTSEHDALPQHISPHTTPLSTMHFRSTSVRSKHRYLQICMPCSRCKPTQNLSFGLPLLTAMLSPMNVTSCCCPCPTRSSAGPGQPRDRRRDPHCDAIAHERDKLLRVRYAQLLQVMTCMNIVAHIVQARRKSITVFDGNVDTIKASSRQMSQLHHVASYSNVPLPRTAASDRHDPFAVDFTLMNHRKAIDMQTCRPI
eukprot:gnl/TRDRNA2_/TRDRNA2_177242_c6_seq1.p1 gnl/TRDRNA2_/TRDRNA2_177242_c6~~gnl/TRDRNA2_/TRDRNA2_177242_c6_seq1.p1  ORF type:complete len:306 (+),score=0.52 gnl/TRDRNA2_/TRDRNA2_177242_c6_seq1:71-988(+)